MNPPDVEFIHKLRRMLTAMTYSHDDKLIIAGYDPAKLRNEFTLDESDIKETSTLPEKIYIENKEYTLLPILVDWQPSHYSCCSNCSFKRWFGKGLCIDSEKKLYSVSFYKFAGDMEIVIDDPKKELSVLDLCLKYKNNIFIWLDDNRIPGWSLLNVLRKLSNIS